MNSELRSQSPEQSPALSRLTLRFDAEALLHEARALGQNEWVTHFNTGYHDGGWAGVALRAANGEAGRLYPDMSQKSVISDTPTLAGCPAIQAALNQFHCPFRAVRLLRLAAGSYIREHRDDDLRFELGEARLHIPLVTHPSVEFYVDGERVIMEEGECWYLDLSRPHRVRNPSPIERIHLVIDCQVNDWLRAAIAAGDVPQRQAAAPSGRDHFLAFREQVWGDASLQRTLLALTDKEQFINEVVKLGAARHLYFGSDDVDSAMTQSRQQWLSQWSM